MAPARAPGEQGRAVIASGDTQSAHGLGVKELTVKIKLLRTVSNTPELQPKCSASSSRLNPRLTYVRVHLSLRVALTVPTA